MGKIFTLLTAFLLLFTGVQAAAPTASTSNFRLGAGPDGNRFIIYFDIPSTASGGGARRIIVAKANSPIDFTNTANLPENGVDYVHSSTNTYGEAGTEFRSTGGFIIYDGTSGSGTTVRGLSPHTTYYFAIFEYNGTGLTTEYRMVPGTGTGATATYPTQQVTGFSFSNVSGNQMQVNFSGGNGAYTLVVARKGSAPVATPTDLTSYLSSGQFGTPSTAIATDEYVVYNNSTNSFWLDRLEPNTTYHFAAYEYNGNNYPVYLKPGATGSYTTAAGPTNKPGNPTFSNQGANRFLMSFGTSNASKYLVVARQGAEPTFTPANGTTVYTGSTEFGSGSEVAPGEFVISTTSSYSFYVTNLQPGTTYYFKIYGYDTDASGFNYYQTTLIGAGNGSTVSAPPDQSTITSATLISGNSLQLNFTRPSGTANNLILAKAGSPVDADPVDLTTYNAHYQYPHGSQIGTGNYVVYNNNGTTVTVAGLVPGTTYHFAIYGSNGVTTPLYKRPGATYSFTMPNEPTSAATAMSFESVEGGSMTVRWTNGTGARRIVIARKGSAVTARPADGISYTANNSFGNGTMIATDEYVVYDGTNTNFQVTNLEANTTYHFAVFEYNGTGTNTDYRTSTFLAGNRTTLAAPTVQVSGINATSIQDDRVTLAFTAGNGANRLFVMKEGAAVLNVPANYTNYNDYSIFGGQTHASYRIADGEYVVRETSASTAFTVTGLMPNTTYHVAGFEFNGVNSPVYLTSPVATFSFTTTGPIVTPTPTVATSAPTFSSIEGNGFAFGWTSGNGTNRIVIAKQGSAPQGVPVNGVSYTANTAFGTPAAAFTAPTASAGEYVVYRGNGSSVNITGLSPNTVYYFAVYEYNGSGTTSTYLTSTYLTASRSTAITPATGSTAASITFPAANSVRLSWTNGPGTNRLVVLKQGTAAITGTPLDLNEYAANTVFGSGGQLDLGEYVVYKSSGNNVTVSGLTAGATYHYRVFDFNGSSAPVYNTADALSGSFVVTTLPLTWVSISGRQTDKGYELKWATAHEINTSHFEIERSDDGVAYTKIGTIAAKGAGSENQYSYFDGNATGKHYYRVKQVDLDGKSEYSKVVFSQTSSRPSKVLLYPNPAGKQVYIQVTGKSKVQIYDSNGRQVRVFQLPTSAYVDIQDLKPGVYMVEVQEQYHVYKTQLIKQ